MVNGKREMTPIDWTAFVLLMIGGINWGLAIFEINLVTAFTSGFGLVVVYGAIAIAGLYTAYEITARKLPKMKPIDNIAIWLLIVGGINWGLGIFEIDLVQLLLGMLPIATMIVYGLIGIAGLYALLFAVRQINK